MMDAESLQKTKKYIDRIFRVRGYDQRLSVMKRDQMCSFPVSLVGLNWTLSRQWQRTLNQASNIAKDDVSELIQSKERISTNSAARFAMEHCVDFMTMDIFKSPDLGNWEMTLQMRWDLIGLVKHSLNYYYYIALSDQKRENLRISNVETTSCDILWTGFVSTTVFSDVQIWNPQRFLVDSTRKIHARNEHSIISTIAYK